jgi:RNA polymerase sigma factor (sigma-70 family)
MNAIVDVFEKNRRRLFAIAHRMLGTRSDAEDLVQDVWLRWSESATAEIQSPLAFLVTVTKRLCLDRLREMKRERGQYPASSSDVREDECVMSPEARHELLEEVSTAFAAVLERLGVDERRAFLMREIFDFDYSELAEVLGKAEPACRQIVRRARARLRDPRRGFSVTAKSREQLLKRFLVATRTGDRNAVIALVTEKVEYVAPASTPAAISWGTSTPRSIKQRPVNNAESVPLFASVVYGNDSRVLADQAQPLIDCASRFGYVCPGRAQGHNDHGTRVYEMDNDTYETTKVG